MKKEGWHFLVADICENLKRIPEEKWKTKRRRKYRDGHGREIIIEYNILEQPYWPKWVEADNPPSATGFVWVRLADSIVELAFYDCHAAKWQYPETVGDYGGLSIEYYDNVTHWQRLDIPTAQQILHREEEERARQAAQQGGTV